MKKVKIFSIIFFSVSTVHAQNIGIGTTNPLNRLHVSSKGSNLLLIENTQFLNTDTTTGLFFKTGNGIYQYTGAIKSIGQSTSESRIGLFTYASLSASGLKERLSILDNGNMGINTTTPTNNLSVAGNADFSGNVGIGTATPAASAQLDVSSTTKGFLPPRMTASQLSAISSPTNGLLVYQTDYPSGLYYFNAGVWSNVATPTHYPSVTICNQKWMDRNLDVTIYRNGDTIAYVTDPAAWAALTTGAWCYYNNDPSTNATYGKLYNWYAVNDARGLAPAGWHVPSDAEWTTLETCLGGSSVAGGKMKVTGTTTWQSPNTGADNSSGWAGLPGGSRSYNGPFYNVGSLGYWWSSTEDYASIAWYRHLYYNNGDITRTNFNKRTGFSVRCLRD